MSIWDDILAIDVPTLPPAARDAPPVAEYPSPEPAIEEEPTEEEQEPLERGLFGGILTGLRRGGVQIQTGLSGVARGTQELAESADRWAAEKFGLDYDRDIASNPLVQRRAESIRASALFADESAKRLTTGDLRKSDAAAKARNIKDWRWWTEGVSEFIPQMAMQMGLAGMTGGSSLGAQVVGFASAGGVMEGGNAYNDARERLRAKGWGDDEAAPVAALEAGLIGTLNGAMEMIPGSVILRKNPAAKEAFDGFLKEAIKRSAPKMFAGAATEGVTEAAQEAWSDTVQWMVENDPKAFENWWERYSGVGLLAAVPGVGAAGMRSVPDLASGLERSRQLRGRQERGRQVIARTEQIPVEDVREWSQRPDNQAAVYALIKQDTPGRTPWANAGLPPAVGPVRKQFADELRRIVAARTMGSGEELRFPEESVEEEFQDVTPPVRGVEKEVREDEGGEDLRGPRQVEERPQPPSEEAEEGVGEPPPAEELPPQEPTTEEAVSEPTTPTPLEGTPLAEVEGELGDNVRQLVSDTPALQDAEVTLDPEQGLVRFRRRGDTGAGTGIHLAADEQLEAARNALGVAPDATIFGAYMFQGRGAESLGMTPGDIYLSRDADHGILNHEMVHWMEDQGIITPEEVEQHGGREGVAVGYQEYRRLGGDSEFFGRIFRFLDRLFSARARFYERLPERMKPAEETPPEAPTTPPEAPAEEAAPESIPAPEAATEGVGEPETAMQQAGITLKKTPKGWTVKGIPQEIGDELKADYRGKRLSNGGYFFREDPTEELARAAEEIAEEAQQTAAAEASGLVRTRIGTLTPEQAEFYAQERQDRITAAREEIEQRNAAVRELISQFVGKGRRGAFKLQLLNARSKDADAIPRFDEMVEYSRNHPELGLPQDEAGLFDLLTNEPFELSEENLLEDIDNQLAAEIEAIIEEEGDVSFDFGANVLEQEQGAQQTAIPGFEQEAASAERSEQARAAKKQFEGRPTEQQALFGKSGLPGQQNLFADTGVPDDMVAKPVSEPTPETAEQPETAAEEAQRRADEARPETIAYGAGLGGGVVTTERLRDDEIPDALNNMPDKEVNRRRKKARGLRKPSLLQRIKDTLRTLRGVTRAQEHIPNTEEFAAANEFFRLLRNVRGMAQDEAIRITAAIVDPLTKNQVELFEWHEILDNLSASLEMGQPLRFGFKSKGDVQSELERVRKLIDRVPAIQEAIAVRRKIVRETVQKLVEYDLLPEAALENTNTYYHQMVHFYMMAQGRLGGGTRAGKVRRSFQKARVLGEALEDESMDYNTSYVESEVSWLTDAYMEIEKERLFRQLMDQYDMKPQLKDRAKRQNFENVVGGPEVAARIDEILGELAESRESEDAQDSAERMRRKALIEELEDIDPTHPYRRQIAKMAGWFRKEQGLDDAYEEWYGEVDDGQFWKMVKEAADQESIPALALLKAVNQREAFIRTTLGDKYATWQSLAAQLPDMAIFQPEQGNQFYRAFTIPERIAEKLLGDVVDTADLSKDDLREVLAMAGPLRQFVVPEQIAAQLQATKKTDIPHGLAKLADEAMRTWKVYTLLNPKRAIAYNLRNLTGDLDPLVASDPTLLKYVNRAMSELTRYHQGRLQLTDSLRTARDHGVVGSGFVAEEVPDIKDLAIFRRFMKESGKTSLPMRPVKGYMDIVKPLTQWREDALRYAAFLGYRQQLQQGKVKHYGGSKKAVVQQIKRDLGVDAAAAHMARNLLGDYGNISVAGNWIRRRLMPFWSFQEINMKRVPRLLANAYESGGTWRTAGALSAAAGRAILMSRVAWMFAGLWVWNHLVQGGDEEEELTGYDRAVPHLVLGRNPDGSIRIFRRVGALGDFLEWFGINEALAMYGKLREGQVNTGDVLKEMAFATPEKAMNSMRPDLKALYEIPTGQSLFPEPFQPRSVRRGEAASHVLGLQDEYRWMKGWILEDGNTARPHYWQRWAVGVVDPRHSALSHIYDLRAEFLKKKGKEQKGVFPVSRYKEARDAAKFEDYDAFIAWKRKYVEDRGNKAKDDFKDWLRTIDPIGSRLNDADELEFATEFLSNEQQQRLTVARNYANELRDLLVTWWDADERSKEIRTAVVFSAFRRIDTTEPVRKDYASEEGFRKAMASFQVGNRRAAHDIRSMTSTYDEAKQLLRDYYNKPKEEGGRGSTILDKSTKKRGDFKPSYTEKLKVLMKIYGK